MISQKCRPKQDINIENIHVFQVENTNYVRKNAFDDYIFTAELVALNVNDRVADRYEVQFAFLC